MAEKSVLKNHGLLIFWILFLGAVVVFILLNQERIYYAIQKGSKPAVSQPITVPADISVPEPETYEPAQSETVLPEPETISVDTEREPIEPEPTPVISERKRIVYFIHVDDAGTISQIQTERVLPVSDTPLFDVLRVLFQGPTTAELDQNLISLIPDNTMILSTDVRNGTAYININEDLQYNQFGQEGYYACLKQIVWTATEFPTVDNVQILIEGAKVNYLSEGIWTGSPLSREDF
ncbi:MAG: GerMN domain-containing protein [Spirochaetaceae bacterium]|jgi:spore germination protein GerM|nr:GerMN domain-containing protein [Spirochaetaceae bacterium]